jgi:hypothetical protein
MVEWIDAQDGTRADVIELALLRNLKLKARKPRTGETQP